MCGYCRCFTTPAADGECIWCNCTCWNIGTIVHIGTIIHIGKSVHIRTLVNISILVHLEHLHVVFSQASIISQLGAKDE